MRKPETIARDLLDQKFGLKSPWGEPDQDGDEGFTRAMKEESVSSENIIALMTAAIETDRAENR